VDPLKIVVSGPVGAGKTTFIRSLSKTAWVDTDEAASEEIGKETTTVALDFGTLEIEGTLIYLFGTPGQDRFDFMWEILCEGALGMVLLVSGQDPRQFPKARAILEFVTSRIAIPFLVGVTRQDLPRVWDPEEVADYFGLPPAQVVGLSTTEPSSCASALVSLLEIVLERQERNPSR
jgi:signal recognition particle receptor subunit beta